ncbi:hypothetical protein C0Q70_20470 [Pomacea canaliculata]|uniref:Polypeptide N-acetylgalactosaminyltransferase n=1 Tax=Pomacea canaliculata TaxID=400727 RepID=A0A2T7NFP3_POMCA|nr:hypothetical protein C0Q70_20470 [Pomacea canaliculata]
MIQLKSAPPLVPLPASCRDFWDCILSAALKEDLDLYLQQHFPENLVKVVRLPQRAGLIRARLEGFRHVTTEVVSFFDSHMEVNVDWLQPLLVEIKRDRRTVAMGHLDYIQPDTFQYSYVPEYHTRYGFDWRLVFFETYFLKSQERGKTVSDPLPGVVMVGPAFAINSDYFREIGTYDSGMKIWGGENLELAWRVWLCGGRLVHLPCSKIGHIARPQPYTFPEGRYETEIHNYKRAVEVWMGPYKRFVYEHHPRMKELDVGDLTERLLLKKNLGCRNFSWFLKNVWPELYPYNDNATHWGGVTHLSETLCLDNGEFLFVGPEPLRTKRCNFNSFSQGFSLTTDRRLRTTLQCVGVQEEGEDMVPVLITCNDGAVHTWMYTPSKQLKHDQTGLCLQLMQGPKLVMQVCRNGEDSQVWEFREQGDPTSIADLEVDQAQRHRERGASMETKSPVQMLYELEQQMRNMSLNLHQPILKDFTALAAGQVRQNFGTPEGEGQKIHAAPGNRQHPEIPGAVGHDKPISRDLIFTPRRPRLGEGVATSASATGRIASSKRRQSHALDWKRVDKVWR